MKTTTLSILLASAACFTRGIASSLGSRATQDQLPEAVGITFTGQAFVDGPNVTLFGSVEQVYNELLKINPAYDPWEFQDYRERMEGLGFSNRHAFDEKKAVSFTSEAQDEKRSLAKRDAFECNPNGDYVGNFWSQCAEGLGYLYRLNGYCGAPRGWGGCSRVSCSHNCAIVLCNDNSFPISVWCGNLAGDAEDIALECGLDLNEWVYPVKGQVFRSQAPGWNTVVRTEGC